MEKLIATYLESRAELRRRFDLFPDSIRVFGKDLFQGRFDQSIPLTGLHPNLDRIRVRGQFYAVGQWMLFLDIIATAATFVVGDLQALAHPWYLGVCGPMACIGLILVTIRKKPVEYATFQCNAPGIPILAIGRVGPQAEEFEEFVTLLRESIHAAMIRASTTPTPTSPGGTLEGWEACGVTLYASPTPPPPSSEGMPGAFRLPPE